jgi:hypothetical protein
MGGGESSKLSKEVKSISVDDQDSLNGKNKILYFDLRSTENKII